jgi:AbrB family looped-hinge helix DNA binding protein
MPKAKVTSKGQITIPKEIREKLHLNPGDKLLFEETEQGEVKISSPKKSIKELRGILHRPGQKPKTVEEMNEGITEYLKEKHKK